LKYVHVHALAILCAVSCSSDPPPETTPSDDNVDTDGDGIWDALDPFPTVVGCPDGYLDVNGDGSACPDIDECADETHDCDTFATCSNSPGSFACTCNEGFAGDGKTCMNTGDCTSSPCSTGGDAAATCADDDPGYTCTCSTGFTFDGATCNDTDACVDNPCDDAGDDGGANACGTRNG